MNRELKDKEMKATQTNTASDEATLAQWVNYKFKEAMIAKAEKTAKWADYISAANGEYYKNTGNPSYKSNHVSNFIHSTIETIRPIMTDNNPRFIALPRTPAGATKAPKIQIALDYEWDREKMSKKLPQSLLTSLRIGTAIFGLFWDGSANNNIGEIRAIPINPFNFFPDPMATCIEDAEYVIYAAYKHVNQLKQSFPDKANLLDGGSIKYAELATVGATNSNITNQVLVLEMWCRDYTTIEVEEERDGVAVKTKKRKYPRGRVITVAPELGIVLRDIENPYRDGKFPFVLLKDYDIPFEFWGEGEVAQLLSPQTYINELNNQIIDNAKLTTNMPWIIDKNSGIGFGKLTNRPGLIIRKNPGSEVRRDQPPPMPEYVNQKIIELKGDIETISGIFDVTQGKRAVGVVAAQAIMALQEAGQARIRLKVRVMEQALSELATMWYSRMQQFWLVDRWARFSDNDGNFGFEAITPDDLTEDFDIHISAGSTMPSNKTSMLDLMIRLAQTQGEDGLPMVDRKAILEFVPLANKKEILQRFEALKQERMAMAMGIPPSGTPVEQAEGGAPVPNNALPQGAIDELLDLIGQLSDEEMRVLLKQVPNLEEILANNLQA